MDCLPRSPKLGSMSTVLSGSVDRCGDKDGAIEIKDKFFQDLKKWRLILRAFLANKYSSKYELDVIDLFTQKILDRLIFIAYCHDNEILSQDYLLAVLQSQGGIYCDLIKIFAKLDDRFNSEPFALSDCDNLEIDDAVLAPIIIELSRTDFTKLSVHVIGEVYENYLGELLKAGKKGIKVQEKKFEAKKKSQGIYYTPSYILDFIVTNTVGIVLQKCKTVEEIAKIRVLDPACGSGSFLIRTFDEFLKHYERVSPSGLFQFETRKKILQENLFGVDLDERAVEIAKLSLVVKALENTSHLSLTGCKFLPNLKLNIRCGDSLITGEIDTAFPLFEGDDAKTKDKLSALRKKFNLERDEAEQGNIFHQMQILEENLNNSTNQSLLSFFKTIENIKTFNFSIAFPDIFKDGGFDCVVGNPPYVQMSLSKGDQSNLKKYLLRKYSTSMGRFNTFGFFTALAINLLKDNGLLGFIIPNTILTQIYYDKLRKTILDKTCIKSILSFDELPFKDAVVENVVTVLCKESSEKKRTANKIDILNAVDTATVKHVNAISQSIYNNAFKHSFNIRTNERIESFKLKMSKKARPISSFLSINQAIALKHEREKYLSDKKAGMNFKPVLDGKYIGRYYVDWDGSYLRYDKSAIHSCKREDIFLTPSKLFFRRVGERLIACFDDKQFYALNTLIVMNAKTDALQYDLKYFLGLFNSKLLNFYYFTTLKSTKKVFSEIQAKQVAQIPIKTIDFDDFISKGFHDKIVSCVESLVSLNVSKISRDRNSIKILSTEHSLDQLIYQLYGLSDSDIAMVEEAPCNKAK